MSSSTNRDVAKAQPWSRCRAPFGCQYRGETEERDRLHKLQQNLYNRIMAHGVGVGFQDRTRATARITDRVRRETEPKGTDGVGLQREGGM